jgi:hypothetical protein
MSQLCRFERMSPSMIRCKICGTERPHTGDPTSFVRPCPAAKSRGLGDTLAKFAHATGIAQAVEAVSKMTGVPCGCKGRQERLNNAFPFKES